MSETTRAIFSGMQMLIDGQWVNDKAIVIDEQRIATIIPKGMIKNHLPARHYDYSQEHYLIPGFIDVHIHGTHGRDVMDATEESLLAMSHQLAQDGVTGFLATTMSAEATHIEAALRNIAALMPNKEGAAILGAHVEGPFIAKTKCGAQCAEHITPIDMDLLRVWQRAANGAIKIMTLAPELPAALDFIEQLQKQDIIASIGHTHATYAETQEAIAAGCTQATHLFNAMTGIHQREPGALAALLLARQMTAELIVDGVHLHPAIVELAYRLKGKDGLLLVTDAMRAKCLADGEYVLGGQAVAVRAGRAELQNGTLAGSTLSMPVAVMNMHRFAKCTLAEAVMMATYNPARVLGLSAHKGTIAVGKDADLVVLDAEFVVQLTVREGREIFRR